MNDVGHGGFGLRSGLRDFYEFLDASSAERHLFVELRPGVLVTAWSLESGGNVWSAPVGPYVFDSIVRDVVGVQTVEETLTRAHTLALCQSTPGTFYYDPGIVSDGRSWDDGVAWWDAGAPLSWDQVPILHIHLTGDADPRETALEALLGFYVGSVGVVQPDLSPSMLADAALAVWNSSTDLANWTESVSAGTTVTRESAIVRTGSFSARLQATAATNPAMSITANVLNVVAGGAYRLIVEYRTEVGNQVPFFLQFGIGGNFITADGLNRDAGSGVALPDTAGEWRRAIVDVLAWASGTFTIKAQGVGAGTLSGTAYFDQVDVKRIWRFNRYEPRLAPDALGSIENGANDIFFGGKTTGSGTLKILNGDGGLDGPLGALDWENRTVICRYGGVFTDGQEITLDDCRAIFTALTSSTDAPDGLVSIDLVDERAFTLGDFPTSVYDSAQIPDLDPKAQSLARPAAYGVILDSKVARVGLDSSGNYGVYELVDTTDWPPGLATAALPVGGGLGVFYLYSYLDEKLASKYTGDGSTKVHLEIQAGALSGDAARTDFARGRVTSSGPFKPFVFETGKNDRFDITLGGVARVCTFGDIGTLLDVNHVAQVIWSAIFAADPTWDGDVQYNYSGPNVGTFCFVRGSATLVLRNSSGANVSRGIWDTIGFTQDADITVPAGGTVYGETQVWDPAVDNDSLTLRANFNGYADDAAGTYTGTPGARIEKVPDVMRHLWVVHMRQDPAKVAVAEFVAARATAPSVSVIFDDKTTFADIIKTLELTGLADITIDGDGVLHYVPYLSAPTAARRLVDADFVSFSMSRSVADVYGNVEIRYARDPGTDQWQSVSTMDPSVTVRFGRPDKLSLDTFLANQADALVRLSLVRQLAAAGALLIKCQTRSALADRRIGERVYVTRARAPLAPGGSLSSAAYRILETQLNPLTGIIDATLVEDVALS